MQECMCIETVPSNTHRRKQKKSADETTHFLCALCFALRACSKSGRVVPSAKNYSHTLPPSTAQLKLQPRFRTQCRGPNCLCGAEQNQKPIPIPIPALLFVPALLVGNCHQLLRPSTTILPPARSCLLSRPTPPNPFTEGNAVLILAGCPQLAPTHHLSSFL